MPSVRTAVTSAAVFVVVAALVSRSSGQDYDFGDTNWDSGPQTERPCVGADCHPTTSTTRRTTRIPNTTKLPATTRSTKKPKKTTTPAAAATTTARMDHKDECTSQEVKKAACVNDGKCFVVKIGSNRIPSCRCHDMWKGKRCEEGDPDFYVMPAGVKAAIGIGVAGVIVVIAAIIGIVFYKRRKNRMNKSRKYSTENKAESVSLKEANGDHDRPSPV
ncbi:hypothetical protein Btru_059197 [Bulinus truncatus]|nr:hypothetical protein Btru_059197 [Bulinus truncatus]